MPGQAGQQNTSITLVNPDSKNPNIVLKVSGGLFEYAFDESKPFLLKSGGLALVEFGGKLFDVSTKINSYRSGFYKNFFPKRFSEAMKFDVEGVATKGAGLKAAGKVAEFAGEALDAVGTVLTVYDVLNPYPGVRSDKEIQDDTEKQFTQLIEMLDKEKNKKN